MKKIKIASFAVFLLCSACEKIPYKKDKIDKSDFFQNATILKYNSINQYGVNLLAKVSDKNISVTFFSSEQICFNSNFNYFNPSSNLIDFFDNQVKNSVDITITKSETIEKNRYDNCQKGGGELVFNMDSMRDILKDNPNYTGYIQFPFIIKNELGSKNITNRQLFIINVKVEPKALEFKI